MRTVDIVDDDVRSSAASDANECVASLLPDVAVRAEGAMWSGCEGVVVGL